MSEGIVGSLGVNRKGSRVLGASQEMGPSSCLHSHWAARDRAAYPLPDGDGFLSDSGFTVGQPPSLPTASIPKTFTLVTQCKGCMCDACPALVFRGFKNSNMRVNVGGSADKTKNPLFSGLTISFFPFSFYFIILVGMGNLGLQTVLNNTKILEKKEPHKHSLGSEHWAGSEQNCLKKNRSPALSNC